MNSALFESLPITGLYVAVAFLMMAFGEIGYQFGVRTRTRRHEDAMASLGSMVGGLLAMAAFVLAFTFSIASCGRRCQQQPLRAPIQTLRWWSSLSTM